MRKEQLEKRIQELEMLLDRAERAWRDERDEVLALKRKLAPACTFGYKVSMIDPRRVAMGKERWIFHIQNLTLDEPVQINSPWFSSAKKAKRAAEECIEQALKDGQWKKHP